jgi:hypothetical protein
LKQALARVQLGEQRDRGVRGRMRVMTPPDAVLGQPLGLAGWLAIAAMLTANAVSASTS